jgi:hypothetical protein
MLGARRAALNTYPVMGPLVRRENLLTGRFVGQQNNAIAMAHWFTSSKFETCLPAGGAAAPKKRRAIRLRLHGDLWFVIPVRDINDEPKRYGKIFQQ